MNSLQSLRPVVFAAAHKRTHRSTDARFDHSDIFRAERAVPVRIASVSSCQRGWQVGRLF